MWQIILKSIDWNAIASAVITAILALLHRGATINKLNKTFGEEAVKEALKSDKKSV